MNQYGFKLSYIFINVKEGIVMDINVQTNEVELVTNDGSSIWVPIQEYDYDHIRDMQELFIDEKMILVISGEFLTF